MAPGAQMAEMTVWSVLPANLEIQLPAPVTTDSVWEVLEKHLFGVLAFVTPSGDFVTYGIGVPLIRMRDPEEANG